MKSNFHRLFVKHGSPVSVTEQRTSWLCDHQAKGVRPPQEGHEIQSPPPLRQIRLPLPQPPELDVSWLWRKQAIMFHMFPSCLRFITEASLLTRDATAYFFLLIAKLQELHSFLLHNDDHSTLESGT